jgi:hypothetical protein
MSLPISGPNHALEPTASVRRPAKLSINSQRQRMPYLSMFFGIIIRMFYNDHSPPHFHAEYQGQRGIFDFDGNLQQGNVRSRTAQRLIKEWTIQHREELEENWNNMREGKAFTRIPPLG